MVQITFVEHDGTRTLVDAEPGQSLMKAATYGNVPGISADCGGNAACGTCRIYVPADWQDRFAAPGRNEQDMLDYIADATPGARLACQNKVSEAMAGMELSLPESQHY